MQAANSDTGLVNENVCCPKSCGKYCNDCYGNDALQSSFCSVKDGNMCYQGPGGGWDKCCAPSIPKDRICGGTTLPPCRKGDY